MHFGAEKLIKVIDDKSMHFYFSISRLIDLLEEEIYANNDKWVVCFDRNNNTNN